MKSVAIVGAGLVGASTAYFLSRIGYKVYLFDREERAALQCSKANGGQISVCNAETWNTWKNVKKGLKWMLKGDAPLLIRPTPTPAKMAWLAGFMRHTINGSHEANTIETILLGKRSSYLYDKIIAKEGISFDQAKCGMLHVYSNEESFLSAKKSADFFEQHGVEWKQLTPSEITCADPKMASFKNLVGGFMTPTDWVGDAHKYSNEIIRVCKQKYGLKTKYGCEVTDIVGDKLVWIEGSTSCSATFDKIIICAGHEIMKWSNKFGDKLNVYPVKGYSITINGAENAPSVSLLDDDKKIVCSNLGGRLRVAGTAELDGANLQIRADRIEPLVKWVNENFPSIDTSNRSDWACLRPMNTNMMPIVKQSKNKVVYYHGGHGHLGWTLSAATSEQLVNMFGRIPVI